MAELQSKLQTARETIREKENKIARLQTELAQNEARANELAAKESQVKRLKEELEASQGLLAEFQESLLMRERRIEELEQQDSKPEEESVGCGRERGSKRKTEEASVEKLSPKKTAMANGLMQEETQMLECASGESKMEELQSELQSELQTAHETIREKENEIAGLQMKLVQVNNEARANELAAKESQVKRLKEELEASQGLLAEFQESLLMRERRIEELEQQTTDGQQKRSAQTQPPPRGGATANIISLRWESRNTSPLRSMCRGGAAVWGSTVYFSGGASGVYRYDSDSDKWSTLPSPSKSYFGIAVIKGQPTTIGGFVYEKGSSLYSDGVYTATSSLLSCSDDRDWTETFPPMPTERGYPSVGGSGHSLVVAGGQTKQYASWGTLLSVVEIMDTNSFQWMSASHLPQPVAKMLMTVCGEKIYMLGGVDKNGERTKIVYTCSLSALLRSRQLPPEAESTTEPSVWRHVADLPIAHSTPASLCGQLVCLGGCWWENYRSRKEVYQYDQVEDEWLVIGDMRTDCREYLAAKLPSGKLVVVGEMGSVQIAVGESALWNLV